MIASSASAQPAILIGHSGAGPLLAAAGAILGQVRGYIFVDAGLPAPGQSWMETIPPALAVQVREMADAQGWLPPWPHWWGERSWRAQLRPGGRFRAWATWPAVVYAALVVEICSRGRPRLSRRHL